MNHFLLSPENRLEQWRLFRNSISDKSSSDILLSLADWFKYAPLSKPIIDYNNPENWPNIWELIHDGYFCKFSVAYAMGKTLSLVGINDFKLLLVKDHYLNDFNLLLKVNNKVLNYDVGTVVDYDDTTKDTSLVDIYYYNGDKFIQE